MDTVQCAVCTVISNYWIFIRCRHRQSKYNHNPNNNNKKNQLTLRRNVNIIWCFLSVYAAIFGWFFSQNLHLKLLISPCGEAFNAIIFNETDQNTEWPPAFIYKIVTINAIILMVYTIRTTLKYIYKYATGHYNFAHFFSPLQLILFIFYSQRNIKTYLENVYFSLNFWNWY